MAKTYVGDIGTVLQVSTGINLTGWNETTSKILIQKPDTTEVQLTPVIEGALSDGILSYEFTSGEIDVAGVWKVQAKIVFDNGHTFLGQLANFTVYSEWT